MAKRKKKKIGAMRELPKQTKVESMTEEEVLEQRESKERVRRCRQLFINSQSARRKHDWEWLVRNLYIRGYHYGRYNRGTKTVTFAARTGVRIPINITWALMRAVRNQVTSFKPKWEVLPRVTTKSAMENARYSSKLLDFIYDKAHVKRKIKEAVTQALLYSIGVWQFNLDRKKNVRIIAVDPFDFYVDPNVRSSDISDELYGAEYVIKTISRPLAAVKSDPQYKNTETLEADNLMASAEYKRYLLQVLNTYAQQDMTENPTVLLRECWYREYDDKGEYKIRVLTYVDSLELPLRDELTDQKVYPFEVYQGEISPIQLYGESWIKQVIPINRVIDALESQIFEYNHFYAKGRFIIDKNSGVRVIVNQHGQIIEKNRGSTVTSLPLQPLPSAPFEQINNFRRYIEDISGAHDVSLGRIPAGIRSGTGIAELKQADATNQDDLVDNLEDFLSRTGSRILNMVAENWNTSRLIAATGFGGKPDYFMAVGEKSRLKDKKEKDYTFGEMRLPLAVIGRDNEVRVQVGSWLAYTKAARKDELKELFRIGAIDQRTLLEYLEFGNIEDITERTRNERLLDLRSSRPSASVARQTGQEMTDEELALAENELMTEGKDQPVMPDDDHEVHMTIHRELIDDPNSEFYGIVTAHVNEHVKQLNWLTKNQAAAQAQGAQMGEAEQKLAGQRGGGPQGQQRDFPYQRQAKIPIQAIGPAVGASAPIKGNIPQPGGGMSVT